MSEKNISLKKIAEYLNGELIGDDALEVNNLSPLDLAEKNDISFFYNKKFTEKLKSTKAGGVILEEKFLNLCSANKIVVKDAHLAYAKISQFFKKELDKVGINSSSSIETKDIHPSSYIGPKVIIEKDVKIGKNVKILGGAYIGEGSEIGENSLIYSNVSIYSETKIGKKCIIHANSVLGSDGLGFANIDDKWEKIEHLGFVNLKDEVEIGAGCTIDKSSTGETLIDKGTKLDNQVHIAHNCKIGENCIIGAKTAIAGTTKLGKRCKIGGGCGIIDNIKIANDVTVTPMSFVTKSITEKGTYSGGSMLMEHKNWLKYSAKLIREIKK